MGDKAALETELSSQIKALIAKRRELRRTGESNSERSADPSPATGRPDSLVSRGPLESSQMSRLLLLERKQQRKERRTRSQRKNGKLL